MADKELTVTLTLTHGELDMVSVALTYLLVDMLGSGGDLRAAPLCLAVLRKAAVAHEGFSKGGSN